MGRNIGIGRNMGKIAGQRCKSGGATTEHGGQTINNVHTTAAAQ